MSKYLKVEGHTNLVRATSSHVLLIQMYKVVIVFT